MLLAHVTPNDAPVISAAVALAFVVGLVGGFGLAWVLGRLERKKIRDK
ncbi:MAG: hypothetical protein M5U26_05815 [Planctomycetota bacterium]|nr:hypothetical protein [Planctomycetota bacterium]